MTRVLAVLNGGDVDRTSLHQWLQLADHVYAADGGADLCSELGSRPVVVGDFDSVMSPTAHLRTVVVHDQETTDFDKLLAVVACDGFSEVVVAGLEGDRPDHVMATLSTMIACDMSIHVLYRACIATLLVSGDVTTLQIPRGTPFSIVPLPNACVTVEGAQWPLQSASLGLGERLSVSNVAESSVSITMHHGRAMIYVYKKNAPWELPWITERPKSG